MVAVFCATTPPTSASPERAVDYRPKDVALHEETDELETPRRINLMPAVITLAVVAVAALVWWSVTQFGDSIANSLAGAQQQVVAWQQSLTAPAPVATEQRTDPAALPQNLVASTPVTDNSTVEAAPSTAGSEAAPVVEANPAAPAAPVVIEQPTPAPVVQPTAEGAAPAVSLLAVLPTPTTQPEVPAAPTTPATVITAANLRQAPSTDSPVVGAATEGQEIVIVGQLADGSWYQLENGAWVFAQLVQNPPAQIPVVEAPPTP